MDEAVVTATVSRTTPFLLAAVRQEETGSARV